MQILLSPIIYKWIHYKPRCCSFQPRAKHVKTLSFQSTTQPAHPTKKAKNLSFAAHMLTRAFTETCSYYCNWFLATLLALEETCAAYPEYFRLAVKASHVLPHHSGCLFHVTRLPIAARIRFKAFLKHNSVNGKHYLKLVALFWHLRLKLRLPSITEWILLYLYNTESSCM